MKVRTKIEGENFTYRNLWYVVERQIEYAEKNKRGSIYDDLVAMVFAFHTLEAYRNFLGDRIDPKFWKKERDHFRISGFAGKLVKVAGLVGVGPTFSTENAYGSVTLLKSLRDWIGHAPTEKISEVVVHEAGERPEMGMPLFGGMVTHEHALTAVADVKVFIEMLHVAARPKLPYDSWLQESAFSGVTYHATGRSEPITE
jgi:hypothetical protein